MPSPWLTVPLSDYEGHMSSAEVQQLGALSELFADAIAWSLPASVAVLGIAGGNGLDQIDGNVTGRVVGIDINPMYLEAVRRRYSSVGGLELYRFDLTEQLVDLEAVQLVHAALLFEHTGLGRCLENALSLVANGGALSVVLQLPSPTEPGVSSGRFPAMQNLKSHFTLIDPASFRDTVERRGFQLQHQTMRSLPARKGFWMGLFRKQ